MRSIVFVFCAALGLVLKMMMGDDTFAACFSALLCYHIFFLFVFLRAEKHNRLNLRFFAALVTHAACIALVVAIACARRHIPFFEITRYLIPGIAPLEVALLASARQRRRVLPATAASGAVPSARSQVLEDNYQDYEEFLSQVQRGKRPFHKPGMTIQEEYRRWSAANKRKSPSKPVPHRTSPRIFVDR